MIGGRAFRAATIALFATGVGAASPGMLRAQDLTCERGDVEVRGLEFRGNRAIGDDELALRVVVTPSSRARRVFRLPLGQKRCLNRPELGNDIDRLRDHYRQRGYYGARVDTLVQQLSRDVVRVIFTIDEGRATILTRYEVQGLDSVDTRQDILRRLRLRVGAPFDYPQFVADIDTIINRLRDAGYYRADHLQGYDVDTASAQATAFITVLPGRQSHFGPHVWQIDPIPGRDVEIDTTVVRRIMGIAPGQRYSDRAIVEAQRALFQLAAYRHIEVAPRDRVDLPDVRAEV
jgi:outer membrane protein insertion porin family